MIIAISDYAGSGKDTVGSMIQYLTEYPFSENKTDDQNRSYNSYIMDVGMGHKPLWIIKKFADPLRQVAAILLGMDFEFLYTDEFKQMVLPEYWNILAEQLEYGTEFPPIPMTGRMFLQKLGTDAVRNNLHENAWVNALMAQYTPDRGYEYPVKHIEGNTFEVLGTPTLIDKGYPNWIITDLRFPNELEAIKERGGITIRVNRTYSTKPVYIGDELDGCSRNDFEQTKPKHISETALDSATFDYVIENDGSIDQLLAKVKEMLIHFKIIANNA